MGKTVEQIEKTDKSGGAEAGSRWFIVVNPHAGSGRTAREWDRIKDCLDRNGISYEYRMTDCRYHATEMVFDASREGFRRFIAVGGDGTIHEVLGGIMLYLDSLLPASASAEDAVSRSPRPCLSDFSVAVIPVGSGNDWIRCHNIPDNPEEIVRLVKSGSFARQDVVRVTTDAGVTYMVNIGGSGFDARVCERVNRCKDKGKRGRMLYIWSLVHNFFTYKPSPMEISLDGKALFSGDCFSVAVGTGKYSGGGMRQTPEAVSDDGLMDVTVIPPLPFMKIAAEIRRLFDGSFLKVRELVAGRCRRLTVAPAGNAPDIVEVDGEIVGRLPATFEVLGEQICVLDRKVRRP
ncbi:MAG: diacylglycerol kinase family lipid kinase [Bacteroidetes bacterium]|uniref:Diacylglycerol kinase family lipid kinase n=1 Tax=Candidatus Cryptobacteroides gallistercoris TaxID=2840765 RepID=A0A940DM13_9BACT|nr:diacylglycerol kinase family lipid kinase [Candidatus Cryptobacteroides gallistercoris]